MSSSNYIDAVQNLITEIKETQSENIAKAAEKFAEAVKNDKII
ncbi:SIS domain-containing protein, partial [Sporanaerobacter acetigenes]